MIYEPQLQEQRLGGASVKQGVPSLKQGHWHLIDSIKEVVTENVRN
jgi:hypothetical protein